MVQPGGETLCHLKSSSEHQMQWFKSSEQSPQFLSSNAFTYGQFHLQRYLMSASRYQHA
jgi:hypothetical protein